MPTDLALEQNYPNPFNPSTKIRFRVPGLDPSWVRLAIYDMLGREVAVLVNKKIAPGAYEALFDAVGLASGVYLYRITAGDIVETRKMVVVK
jgi:glucuronoarabinoxylan endo-1,4-beta-xylanase